MDTRFRLCGSLEEFAALERDWNSLALLTPSPFSTHEWISSWWRSFGGTESSVLLLRGADGELLGGASLLRESGRRLRAAVNEYSEEWDVVAADDSTRRLIWEHIAALPAAELSFAGIPAESPSMTIAPPALRASGYRVAVQQQQLSPHLSLPPQPEDLLQGLSRNARSQLRRKRRKLEAEGEVIVRTTRDPTDLDAALNRFFQIEASGWKGEAGTAIVSDPRALRLFTDFAHAAAVRGWLRIHLLELDGVAIAGDYACVLGNVAFLVKTGYDERFAGLSPGSVLRTEALEAAIGEHLGRYEFLGGPDRYKLQWGGEIRERQLLRAYRGSRLPTFFVRHRVRPAAGRLRARVRRRRRSSP